MLSLKKKKERLSTIKSEVNELHPLLHDLLQKLRHVNYVEYTHGPNEKGADFVIEKYDPTMDEVYWIGVVVKLGKIHQNFSDVERQIKECFLHERVIKGGVKRVKLNEVWIISSGGITHNAAETIEKEFSSKRIAFVDDVKLISWIDKNMAYFWHQLPGALGIYLQKMWDSALTLDRNSELSLKDEQDFYIPLDIVRVEKNIYEKKLRLKEKVRFTSLDKEIENNKVMLVEGGMGSGKSKIVREAVKSLSTPESYAKTKYVPVFSTYKSLVSEFGGKIELLIERKLGGLIREIDENETTYIIFVDGIDEVLTHENTLDQLNNIVHQVQQKSGYKLILTSRPIPLFEGEPQLFSKLTQFRIQPLSFEKLVRFIESACEKTTISERLREDLRKSDLFKQLPKSPIAAILLARILKNDPKDLPSSITELYSQALEHMLGRWDIGKGMNSQLEYDSIDRSLGQLSRMMIENDIPEISKGEVERLVGRYLVERNIDLTASDLLEKTISRSDVLSIDNNKGTIRFKHRSFCEFLYAKELVKTRSAAIDDRVYDLYWQNSYFFYIGLLRDCPEELKKIVQIPVVDEKERLIRVMALAEYFLAGHHSPYNVVEENLYKIFIDAAELFKSILIGDSKVGLEKYSPMQVLWFMQYLIRQAYSYKYFSKAMQDTVLRIADSIHDRDVISYALFFVGVVCIDLNQEEPFKYLLENVKEEDIPLPVSLALEHEYEQRRENNHSPLMKKHSKKLRKIIKTHKSIKSEIDRLINSPIDSKPKLTEIKGSGTSIP